MVPKSKNDGVCEVCGSSAKPVSSFLGICGSCIIEGRGKERVGDAHRRSRSSFDLPSDIPSSGKPCGGCVNRCRIGEGQKGYCGIRGNVDGEIKPLVEGAVVDWYYDPLPTNCVATFVCPGGTGAGYPEFAHSRGPEYGHKNLSVFYGACTYDCLFCQNWIYRPLTRDLEPVLSADELAAMLDDKTSCVCFFGGDPTPQIDHAIRTAEIAIEREGITRICFETNGSMSRGPLRRIAELAYDSGGCIKVDLKTWNDDLNLALCGTSNRNTISNFEWLVDYEAKGGDRGFPFIVASTLMIPGYVEADEVDNIASFLASLNPDIPFSLLAFHGAYEMADILATSRKLAEACYSAAKNRSLTNIRIGNIHLLW